MKKTTSARQKLYKEQKLTPTQQKLFNYLVKYFAREKIMPTRLEIAEEFGWSSPNAAQCHLLAIERKGFISMPPKKARAIFILG